MREKDRINVFWFSYRIFLILNPQTQGLVILVHMQEQGVEFVSLGNSQKVLLILIWLFHRYTSNNEDGSPAYWLACRARCSLQPFCICLKCGYGVLHVEVFESALLQIRYLK
ncbi:hypothetical protein Hanom_Chr14g01304551 [Helianthus anomalus]